MRVDHINKESHYLSQNYGEVSLNSMTENYRLFYSNENPEGNVLVLMVKAQDEPKYMTKRNFVLDSEAFKEMFGDQEFLKKITSIFGVEADDPKMMMKMMIKVIKVIQMISEIGGEIDEVDLV